MPYRKSAPNFRRRAVCLALTYLVVTGGLLGALLLQLRTEAIVAGERELSALAQLTAGHTLEVVQSIEESLKIVEVTLSVASDVGSADADSIRAVLRDFAGGARGLTDIFVLDARGRVIYQASGDGDLGLDRSDRPYFVQYRDKPELKFDVGAALRLPSRETTGEWFIPVSHVWRRTNGEFAGVIVGVMEPRFFDKAWTFDSEITGLSITLTRKDGALITRRPFMAEIVGRSLAIDWMSSQFPDEAAGTLQSRSSFDGLDQLQAYRKVAPYPNLIIFVAQPMDVVLAGWWRIVWIVSSGWVLASIALGGLGAWLAHEMKVRGSLEDRYRTLFDSIPYPVIVSDYETQHILAFNDVAMQQYGWSPVNVPGNGPTIGVIPLPADFAPLVARRQELSKETPLIVRELQHHTANGTAIDVEMTVRLIDYNGRLATLTIVVDVTDRLRTERARQTAEDQLRQSQKMEVLGQLTGGIAHDFNNILTVIMDNAEALTDRNTGDAETVKRLDRITDSAQRAEDLTRQMLAFSRKQPLRPRPTNINDLVASTGKMMRRTLGEQVEIDAVLADEMWMVDIDRAQLETTLVNLCINARDAMPEGGRLLIQTQNVTLGENHLAGNPQAARGDYVLLTVSDTGRGILPRNLDKVFEPFFTTKEGGKGPGLGLSMVYGFIKQSNGHIDVQSEIDRGTSFKLYLPRYDGAPEETATRRNPQAKGGSERILVVEDDPQVRASVVDQLQSLGYTVSQAADGTAGLAAFDGGATRYDLMLTDVIMPGGLNGKALADEVARRWPMTRIVFMSGYSDNALIQHGRLDAAVRLLSKPFRKADLALIIRQVLDDEVAPALN